MSIFYSASTGGFYDTAIHAGLFVEHIDLDPETGEALGRSVVPDPDGPIAGAIEITTDEHRSLLEAQAAGKVITADANGHPVAVDPPRLPLDQLKAALCVQVDAAAETAYAAIGSNSPGRLEEYRQAGADATAFKAAGYAGDAPATVACWAQAQGWTAQQACDDILSVAAAWEGALVSIRSTRLLGKAGVNAAADAAGAQAAADAAITTILAVSGD